jgi:hypothetical protein
MQEDYLWDKTGAKDPEIEALEKILKPFEYQPKPLERTLVRPPRRTWIKLAVAAILLAMVTAVMWRWGQESPHRVPLVRVATPEQVEIPYLEPTNVPAYVWTGFEQEAAAEAMAINMDTSLDERATGLNFTPMVMNNFDSEFVVRPYEHPVLNDVIVAHIEKVELLLRSFRNGRASEADVAYDKKRARDLLMPHIVLRRDAETTGDLAAKELLNSLEPYLLDIANLKNQPIDDEAKDIKNRMQRQSIMVALHIYGPQ